MSNLASAPLGYKLEDLPPHNLEAEQAVMGSLLLDPDAIAKLFPWFSSDCFLRAEHQVIYQAVRELYRTNAPIDIVTLADLLMKQKKLGIAGGLAYIHTLATMVPTAIHVEHYARIVQEKALSRQMIQAGAEIAKLGYDETLAIEDRMQESKVILANLLHSDKHKFEGIFKPGDAYDDVFRLYEQGWQPGEATCWPEMDQHFRVAPGEFTVVTGIPNHGKSEWVDGLAIDFAKRLGWGVAMYSPENWPIKLHIAKLMEKYCGAPFNNGPHLRLTQSEMSHAMGFLHEHFTFVMPPRGQRGLQALIGQFEAVITKQPNVRLAIIDPWNRLEHRRPKQSMISEYTSEALDMLTELAKTTQVHLMLVVHPHQMQPEWSNKAKRKVQPVPGIYDINDGAAFANKADNIITVWRDVKANNGHVDFHIQKVRFKINGRPGKVSLLWDSLSGNFYSDISAAAEPEVPLAEEEEPPTDSQGGLPM